MRLSSLPRFNSLLVHGTYLPSAPIRLSLSVPQPHSTLFFTPSRNALLRSLHDDHWLTTHSGTGTVASMSSRVSVFYPPSPKHLIALLAMLRTHDFSSPVAPEVTLDRPPALLVLHEPSSYFLSEQEEHTLSSYLLLIIHALATIEYLSSQSVTSSPASLVVFDSRLDQLKLPVLRSPSGSTLEERDESEDAPKAESVLFFAEKYFELSGTFQLPEVDPGPVILALRRTEGGETDMPSESFFAFVLKPGSSLHPSFLLAVDCAFTLLFLVFVWSAYLTKGNIHFFILMVIEMALWASVKWFVHELKTLPASSEHVPQKKDQ